MLGGDRQIFAAANPGFHLPAEARILQLGEQGGQPAAGRAAGRPGRAYRLARAARSASTAGLVGSRWAKWSPGTRTSEQVAGPAAAR